MPRIVKIETELQDKSERSEFFDLKVSLTEEMKTCVSTVEDLTKKTEKFAKVVERFDEILLDKASKDDIGKVKAQLPLFLLQTAFDDREAMLD